MTLENEAKMLAQATECDGLSAKHKADGERLAGIAQANADVRPLYEGLAFLNKSLSEAYAIAAEKFRTLASPQGSQTPFAAKKRHR